ncbi:hypothetical protein PS1_030065 [Malus domestica]
MERLRCSKFFLVGKVLSRKMPRGNVVIGMFKDQWQPKANVAAMAFLLLAEVKGLEVPVAVPLREQVFWVRVHGLLLTIMSKHMREELGATLGRLVAVDCDKDGTSFGRILGRIPWYLLWKGIRRQRQLRRE